MAELSRRDSLKLAGLGLLGMSLRHAPAQGKIKAIDYCLPKRPVPGIYFGEYSIAGLFNVIERTSYREYVKEGELILKERMKEKGLTEIVFDTATKKACRIPTAGHTIENIQSLLPRGCIILKESPLFQVICDSLGEYGDKTRAHVNSILFLPRIEVEGRNGTVNQYSGAFAGEGRVHLSAFRDGIKPPWDWQQTLVHEANHAYHFKDGKDERPTLLREEAARREGLLFLEQISGKTDDPNVTVLLKKYRGVNDTAQYLKGLGEDFHGIYPSLQVEARRLLKAGISAEVLENAGRISTGHPKDAELHAASEMALALHVMDFPSAFSYLSEMVGELSSLREQNAFSALKYLVPENILAPGIFALPEEPIPDIKKGDEISYFTS